MTDGLPQHLLDRELWDAFVAATLPPKAWTHRTHVRIGYLHIIRYPFAEALDHIRSRIQRLNAAHGTPEAIDRGYHETITCAFLRLIAAVAAEANGVDSDGFCEQHPKLLDKRLLLRFYSRERIMSAEAKGAFVEPDLQSLPAASCDPTEMSDD